MLKDGVDVLPRDVDLDHVKNDRGHVEDDLSHVENDRNHDVKEEKVEVDHQIAIYQEERNGGVLIEKLIKKSEDALRVKMISHSRKSFTETNCSGFVKLYLVKIIF